MFLFGMPFEPALAGISPSIRISISDSLLYRQFALREYVGDRGTGITASVDLGFLRTVFHRDEFFDCGFDFGSVVGDIDDVRSALPPLLTRTDVHRGNAEICAFTDADAGVADYAFCVREKFQKILGLHVLEETDVLRIVFLSEGTDSAGCPIGTCVDVRPEPQRGQIDFTDRVETLGYLLLGFLIFRRDGMLHDDDVSI